MASRYDLINDFVRLRHKLENLSGGAYGVELAAT